MNAQAWSQHTEKYRRVGASVKAKFQDKQSGQCSAWSWDERRDVALAYQSPVTCMLTTPITSYACAIPKYRQGYA